MKTDTSVPARLGILLAVACALLALLTANGTLAGQTRRRTVDATDRATLRTTDPAVQALTRSGVLEVRRVDRDTLLRGRTHTRLQQFHRGVPVFGAEVTRQADASGATVSLFGAIYPDVDVDTTPTLTAEDASAIVARISGVAPGPLRPPALAIVPTESGYTLAYSVTTIGVDGAAAYLVDARTGHIVRQTTGVQEQSAVGAGTGVLGDRKKMSVTAASGVFTTSDLLRIQFQMIETSLQVDLISKGVSKGVQDIDQLTKLQ